MILPTIPWRSDLQSISASMPISRVIWRSLGEELLQRVAQRSRVEIADDATFTHQRDLALLLRHHHDDGVRLLRETDGGAVTSAERLGDIRIHRQWQEASRGGDASLLDDDRAVVNG